MANSVDHKAYVHTYGKQDRSSENVVVTLCKDRNDATVFTTLEQAENHRKDFNLNGFPFESGDGSAFVFTGFEIEEASDNCFWIYGVGPFGAGTVLP